MDVTRWPRRFAARRPRPFVVSAAGGARVRVAAEAELRARGWRTAASPAHTGFLVVCGAPGPELAEAIERVWDGMPGPRARAGLGTAVPESVAARFAEAAPATGRAMGDVPMADRADDRDGLRLDVLHVPLGPVLAWWPAGLRLDLVLQGDIVQRADVTVVEEGESFWDEPWRLGATRGERERRRAAAHLDSLGRFLRVAGWDGAAGRAVVLRDEVLAGKPEEARFASLAHSLERSRALRWMTRGLGVLTPEAAARYGVEGPALRYTGDVWDRVVGWLRETGRALERIGDRSPGTAEGPRGRRADGLTAVLPGLVEGLDVAAARLVVASLDPDPAGG